LSGRGDTTGRGSSTGARRAVASGPTRSLARRLRSAQEICDATRLWRFVFGNVTHHVSKLLPDSRLLTKPRRSMRGRGTVGATGGTAGGARC